MAASPTVEILEVSTVKPPSSASQQPFSLPLTFYDIHWLKCAPNLRVFFYELPNSTPNFLNETILPRLKHSLSQAFLHYPLVASHVEWQQNSPIPIIVRSPDDGVSLTVAVSNASFDSLASDEPRTTTHVHPYTPELFISETKADVIALQITLFPSRGFSIGYALNHLVLDGRSVMMFMKSWSHICKQMGNQKDAKFGVYLLPEELTPCFDRSLVKDPSGLQDLFLNQWRVLSGADSDGDFRTLKASPMPKFPFELVQATFKLRREDLIKLKEKFQSEDQTIRLTSFVVTTAYVLVCMVKACDVDKNREVALVFSADYRTRVDPPLPSNYIGNCIFTHALYGSLADELIDQNGVAITAKKLRKYVNELDKRLFEDAEGNLVNVVEHLKQGAVVITVAGSPQLGFYETDFGWGSPKKAEVATVDRAGVIYLSEGRNGDGGIEIGLALRRHEMDVFAGLFRNGLNQLY